MTQTEQKPSRSEIELAQLQAKVAIAEWKHREAMVKLEEEIEAKIERLEPLSPEEQIFYTMQQSKRGNAVRERIADALEEIASNTEPSDEEQE